MKKNQRNRLEGITRVGTSYDKTHLINRLYKYFSELTINESFIKQVMDQ